LLLVLFEPMQMGVLHFIQLWAFNKEKRKQHKIHYVWNLWMEDPPDFQVIDKIIINKKKTDIDINQK
jgi:hypothetical protein